MDETFIQKNDGNQIGHRLVCFLLKSKTPYFKLFQFHLKQRLENRCALH